MRLLIREAREVDTGAIDRITRAAFASAEHSDGTEAAIVDALRQAGALTCSLVAEQDGAIVGHVAFSPVRIGGEDLGWHGLGPVSVDPAHQRQGVGDQLIREGLARLRQAGSAGCVVLGEPAYYDRFGFKADTRLTYAGPPAEYFQSLVFSGSMPVGAVTYHPAFG